MSSVVLILYPSKHRDVDSFEDEETNSHPGHSDTDNKRLKWLELKKKIIIITPRADPLTKIFSALFFVPFILKKLTMISLHFQLFNSYTNRHTMLIILEV